MKNLQRCQTDKLFKVITSDLLLSAFRHKLCLSLANVDGETLSQEDVLVFAFNGRFFGLLAHRLEHLMHVLVRRSQVLIRVERLSNDLLPDDGVQIDVPRLRRPNRKTDDETKLVDLLEISRSDSLMVKNEALSHITMLMLLVLSRNQNGKDTCAEFGADVVHGFTVGSAGIDAALSFEVCTEDT